MNPDQTAPDPSPFNFNEGYRSISTDNISFKGRKTDKYLFKSKKHNICSFMVA